MSLFGILEYIVIKLITQLLTPLFRKIGFRSKKWITRGIRHILSAVKFRNANTISFECHVCQRQWKSTNKNERQTCKNCGNLTVSSSQAYNEESNRYYKCECGRWWRSENRSNILGRNCNDCQKIVFPQKQGFSRMHSTGKRIII